MSPGHWRRAGKPEDFPGDIHRTPSGYPSVGRLPPLPTSVSPDVTEGTTATRSWSTRTGGPYYRLREHRWQEKLAQDPNKNSLENCLDKWVRYRQSDFTNVRCNPCLLYTS